MTGLAAAEPIIRVVGFCGVFALMTLWEIFAPRRALQVSKAYRWTNNLGILVVGIVLTRLVFPAAGVGVALYAADRGWGLFNLLELGWIEVLAGFLLLDFAIWVQHRLFHTVPWLWRLHRVHHADQDFDVTTGLRFHPVEILISMLIKACVIISTGAPVESVLAFEIALNATSMFNHGNVRLPTSIDRVLRWILVTPDMHRVHHSTRPQETNSNFGFNLPVWDRWFGTYRDQPEDGHLQMTIGLTQFRSLGDLRIDKLLLQPLLTSPVDSAEVEDSNQFSSSRDKS